MHRNRWFIPFFFFFMTGAIALLGQQTSNKSDIVHFGYSSGDRLLDCLGRTYGKHTARAAIPNLQFSECPTSKNDLLKLLDDKQIQLIETPDWIYIVPSHYFASKPEDTYYEFRMKWKRVSIVQEAIAGNEGVSQSEAQTWSGDLLSKARMIPLFPPQDPTRDDEAIITIRLRFYRIQLCSGCPDSVITTIDQLPQGSAGRLVYGEIRDGRYQVLWDSPLYHSYGLPEFTDVNGDGSAEILFEAWTPGNMEYPILFIFAKDGRELTRQKKCETSGEPFDANDGVCAIQGRYIRLSPKDPLDRAAKEIRVQGWDGDGLDHVFKLVDGVYVPGPPLRPSRSRKAPQKKSGRQN